MLGLFLIQFSLAISTTLIAFRLNMQSKTESSVGFKCHYVKAFKVPLKQASLFSHSINIHGRRIQGQTLRERGREDVLMSEKEVRALLLPPLRTCAPSTPDSTVPLAVIY